MRGGALLVWLAWLAASVQAANILAVFPFPAKSHHSVFQPVLVGLAAKGHQVTYLTPNPVPNPPPNLKQVQLTNLMNKMKEFHDKQSNSNKDIYSRFQKWLGDQWCNLLIRQAGEMTGDMLLQDQVFQDIVQDTKAKYDLILLETSFAQEAFAALSHRFGAPIVEILPADNIHWAYYLHGIPYDTNYIVDVEVSYSDRMSFTERLVNTLYSMLNRFSNVYYFMPKAQALADTYIRYPGWEDRPPLLDMVKNTSLLLLNSHVAVNYPHPLPPNVQLIGGINLQRKPKPLPQDLQTFMDEAKDGVIYFTLGSHIEVSSTLGDKLKDEFLFAFGKLKQRVLWKWETDFPDLPPNVKVSKWFPQQSILAHKNMKLFITHGGGLSTTEAIYNAVPLVGIPILGDQPKNVNHAKVTGYGVHLDFNNLTRTSISWAIDEVLSNPKYKETVQERSAIYRDTKQTPLQTALYWIEYVLRHNGAHHLQPAVAKMPWCQQALIDVYLVLAAVVALPFVVFYLIFKSICNCLCRRKPTQPKKTKKKRE